MDNHDRKEEFSTASRRTADEEEQQLAEDDAEGIFLEDLNGTGSGGSDAQQEERINNQNVSSSRTNLHEAGGGAAYFRSAAAPHMYSYTPNEVSNGYWNGHEKRHIKMISKVASLFMIVTLIPFRLPDRIRTRSLERVLNIIYFVLFHTLQVFTICRNVYYTNVDYPILEAFAVAPTVIGILHYAFIIRYKLTQPSFVNLLEALHQFHTDECKYLSHFSKEHRKRVQARLEKSYLSFFNGLNTTAIILTVITVFLTRANNIYFIFANEYPERMQWDFDRPLYDEFGVAYLIFELLGILTGALITVSILTTVSTSLRIPFITLDVVISEFCGLREKEGLPTEFDSVPLIQSFELRDMVEPSFHGPQLKSDFLHFLCASHSNEKDMMTEVHLGSVKQNGVELDKEEDAERERVSKEKEVQAIVVQSRETQKLQKKQFLSSLMSMHSISRLNANLIRPLLYPLILITSVQSLAIAITLVVSRGESPPPVSVFVAVMPIAFTSLLYALLFRQTHSDFVRMCSLFCVPFYKFFSDTGVARRFESIVAKDETSQSYLSERDNIRRRSLHISQEKSGNVWRRAFGIYRRKVSVSVVCGLILLGVICARMFLSYPRCVQLDDRFGLDDDDCSNGETIVRSIERSIASTFVVFGGFIFPFFITSYSYLEGKKVYIAIACFLFTVAGCVSYLFVGRAAFVFHLVGVLCAIGIGIGSFYISWFHHKDLRFGFLMSGVSVLLFLAFILIKYVFVVIFVDATNDAEKFVTVFLLVPAASYIINSILLTVTREIITCKVPTRREFCVPLVARILFFTIIRLFLFNVSDAYTQLLTITVFLLLEVCTRITQPWLSFGIFYISTKGDSFESGYRAEQLRLEIIRPDNIFSFAVLELVTIFFAITFVTIARSFYGLELLPWWLIVMSAALQILGEFIGDLCSMYIEVSCCCVLAVPLFISFVSSLFFPLTHSLSLSLSLTHSYYLYFLLFIVGTLASYQPLPHLGSERSSVGLQQGHDPYLCVWCGSSIV